MVLSFNGSTSSPKCCPISGAGTRTHTCHQAEHTFVLNCSVQNTLTWSQGFFKLSSLSCYTGKAGDNFQPSVFLSAPVFRVWTALNLWRASLITNTCSPSYPPWLLFLRHCKSLCLLLNDAGAQSGPALRFRVLLGLTSAGGGRASALVTLSHCKTMQMIWGGGRAGESWTLTLGTQFTGLNKRQPFSWLPPALS